MSKITVETERKFSIKDGKSLPEGSEYSIKQWYLPKKAYSFDGRNLTISNCITVFAVSNLCQTQSVRHFLEKDPRFVSELLMEIRHG